MASSSSSGLTFKLHPLVIVNISDHYTRVKSQTQPPHLSSNGGEGAAAAASPPPPPPRVFGCVIGVQRGRTVEIFNSFELLYDPSTHSLDRSFLEKKQELCQSFSTSLPLYISQCLVMIQVRVFLVRLFCFVFFFFHVVQVLGFGEL